MEKVFDLACRIKSFNEITVHHKRAKAGGKNPFFDCLPVIMTVCIDSDRLNVTRQVGQERWRKKDGEVVELFKAKELR